MSDTARSISVKAESFLPPLPHPLFQRLCEWAAPLVLLLGWRIEAVEIAPADRQRLRALASTPALFVANHPTLAEPVVVFHVLRRASVTLHMMTARDTMVAYGRLVARLFQWLGAYSIRRGRRDRPAMQMTEELLVRGERVLIFPEGQTYGLNDTLLPFQAGVLLMGFHAAEALVEAGSPTPLLVAPLAVKYIYTRPMLREVEAALQRLERALRLAREQRGYYARLLRIALAVLSRMEQAQELPPGEPGDLKGRIDRLRVRIVGRLAEALGVRVPAGADVPATVQLLANAYEDFLERPEGGSEAADANPGAAAAVPDLYRLWLHLKHFIAIRDDYVSEWPSAERFLDVLGRLETDILGKSGIRGARRALVRVGEPVDLCRRLEAYRQNRRETLSELTVHLEESVRGMLRELSARTPPLEELREDGF